MFYIKSDRPCVLSITICHSPFHALTQGLGSGCPRFVGLDCSRPGSHSGEAFYSPWGGLRFEFRQVASILMSEGKVILPIFNGRFNHRGFYVGKWLDHKLWVGKNLEVCGRGPFKNTILIFALKGGEPRKPLWRSRYRYAWPAFREPNPGRPVCTLMPHWLRHSGSPNL